MQKIIQDTINHPPTKEELLLEKLRDEYEQEMLDQAQ